jgi:predicted DNA-binding protein (MmcQ/YjbR family)
MEQKERIEEIKAYCLAKPDAFEDHPWGDTVFKVAPKGKIFCFCGSESAVITVKSTLEKQAALLQHPNIEMAAYVGRHGWVTVHLRDEETFRFGIELIDESFDLIAPKRRYKGKKDD